MNKQVCTKKAVVLFLVSLVIISLIGCQNQSTGNENILSVAGNFDKTPEPPQLKQFKDLKNFDIQLKKDPLISGNAVLFYSIQDMVQCLKNESLRTEYLKTYDINLPKYYYIPDYCLEHQDNIQCVLSYSSGLFQVVLGYNPEKGSNILELAAFGRPQDNVATSYNINTKGVDVSTAKYKDHDVYWYYTEQNKFSQPATCYCWQQESFMGVLILKGKPNQDDIKMCNMQKQVFYQ